MRQEIQEAGHNLCFISDKNEIALKMIVSVSPERTSLKYAQQDNSVIHTTEPTEPWISFSPLISQKTTEDYRRLLE